MKVCHPLMGQLPPNHEAGRVMASLHPRNLFLQLTGRLSGNLVVLVVVLLLDGEDFLVREENIFVPVLGLPMEETLCSCRSDRLQRSSNDVSLWEAMQYLVLIVPVETRQ
jgi:hypothetical protein